MQEKMNIYTDGGCTGNPGPGGWAAIMIPSSGSPVEISGGSSSTTNNRMELTAVIKALEKAEEMGIPSGGRINVYTDSQYVQKGISEWMRGWIAKGWKTSTGKPVKNKDLWMDLKKLNDGYNIEWQWVKGHDGNPMNERCDTLVALERARFVP